MTVPPAPDPAPRETGPGIRLRRLKVVALVVLVVGLVADLVTKAWMQDLLQIDPGARGPFGRIEILPGFFALEGTTNPGVTFGLAPGRTEWILVFTIAATLALLVWLLASRRPSRVLHVSLGMILGGALGNLYDRVRWHEVRDFLLFYVGDAEWPNFNVADSLIVVGVALIILEELFGRRRTSSPAGGGGTT